MVQEGHHGAIFAYGKTATGKTHTMIGSKGGELGIIPLAVQDCFRLLELCEDSSTMSIHVSYFEIYNDE